MNNQIEEKAQNQKKVDETELDEHVQLIQAVNEADAVNLQQFRLQEIQKVARNLDELRKERELTKEDFMQHGNNLTQLNSQIKSLQETFETM